jgi:hypothetical protein
MRRRFWAVVEKSTGRVRIVAQLNLPSVYCTKTDAQSMCPPGGVYVVREVNILVKRTGKP